MVRDGASIRFQVFGAGRTTLLLLPTWSIVHTDLWRHQVAHHAARHTVLTFDGLGNGASDRPLDPSFYADEAFAMDAARVMDAAGVERAIVVSVSMAAAWQLLFTDRYPERVIGGIFISTDLPLAPLPPGYAEAAERFDDDVSDPDGWGTWNREFWMRDWPTFCRFFFSRCFTEPDSEAAIQHFLSMALETRPEVIAATIDAETISEDATRTAAARRSAPTLVIHGSDDAISSIDAGRELARLAEAELVVLPGSGHEPQCRDPRTVNALIDGFIARLDPDPR